MTTLSAPEMTTYYAICFAIASIADILFGALELIMAKVSSYKRWQAVGF